MNTDILDYHIARWNEMPDQQLDPPDLEIVLETDWNALAEKTFKDSIGNKYDRPLTWVCDVLGSATPEQEMEIYQAVINENHKELGQIVITMVYESMAAYLEKEDV